MQESSEVMGIPHILEEMSSAPTLEHGEVSSFLVAVTQSKYSGHRDGK